MTMTHIQTIEVGSGGAASIEFTGISGDFKDLCLLMSAQSDNPSASVDNINIEFNSVATSYNNIYFIGTGSSTTVGTLSSGFTWQAPESGTSAFGNASIYIPNYAGSTNKTYSVDGVSEYNGTAARQTLTAGLWSNTAAITSIKLTVQSYDFSEFSSASLYGIS